MNILLIGSGGREHALAWKLAQSPLLDTMFAAPGNPGIAQHTTCVDLDANDHLAIVAFCEEKAIGLVVIGPEGPLVNGLADSLRAAGVPVFGPDKAAARLEGSKGFTKDLCAAHGIPTAAFIRYSNAADAHSGAGAFGYPVVIKADGIAAGKGVIIAENSGEALSAIDAIFAGAFGSAGAEIVIEEFMSGEEVSLFALTDGITTIAFASAQDHKRVGDGDTGPNTGGMGAFSPAAILTPELETRAMEEIVRPTVAAMNAAGTPFIGVLYAGLMLANEGPKLIEYNVRFGDPETQAILPRLEGDLAALLLAVATGELANFGPFNFSPCTALTVVIAAQGYPGTPKRGGTIENVTASEAKGVIVFHAGTSFEGKLVAAGGRVLGVTALGADIASARSLAYTAVGRIDYADGFYRSDIGLRETLRVQKGNANDNPTD